MELFLTLIYTLIVLSIVTIFNIPILCENLTKFGKLLTPKTSNSSLLYLPKNWFFHFYALFFVELVIVNYYYYSGYVSTGFNLVKSILSQLGLVFERDYAGLTNLDKIDIFLLTMLTNIQCIRRLYESSKIYFNQTPMKSKIHLFHYLFGLIHYSLVAANLFFIVEYSKYVKLIDFNGLWWKFTGAAIFCWSSYHQYKCHEVLYNLRFNSNQKSGYSIPHGDLFNYSSNPHYFCEILIYLSFIILTKGKLVIFWGIVGCTAVNLGFSSAGNHNWYLEKFGAEYPVKRSKLIPFVW
jgi:3-oxo-5-alpha-steroid 4-dehydrogenase 3